MKKYAAILLAGMMALSLAACGGSGSGNSNKEEAAPAETETVTEETGTDAAEAATDAAAGTAAEFTTVSEGELHMATNAAFPPYEMTSDGEGYATDAAGDVHFEGIDVEVAAKIAEKLGLKLVIDDMEFGSVITSVQSGKADMAMAGLTVTEERKQNVDFTDSYATGVQVVIVPEDSPPVTSTAPIPLRTAVTAKITSLPTPTALWQSKPSRPARSTQSSSTTSPQSSS